MEGDSFRMAWNEACLQAGLPSIGLDTAARIMAVIHIESGLCRGWEVCRVPVCRGATAFAPFDGPVGPNKYVRVPVPVGTSARRMLLRPYTDAAKPAGFHTKNRFEAPNPPGFTPKTDLKPKTRRGLRQKPIRSPKPAKDCTKNRFGA